MGPNFYGKFANWFFVTEIKCDEKEGAHHTNAEGASANGNGASSEVGRALRELTEARRVPDVLRHAQAELAPVRVRAMEALASLDAAINKHRPFLESAIARYNAALAAGVNHMELSATLRELMGYMETGCEFVSGIVLEIDRLTEYTVQNRWHVHIAAKLNLAVAPMQLDALAERASIYLRELDERILARASVRAEG